MALRTRARGKSNDLPRDPWFLLAIKAMCDGIHHFAFIIHHFEHMG
jgi:hypothetical protein